MNAFSGSNGLVVYEKIAKHLLDHRSPHAVRGESMASEILGCLFEVHDAAWLDFDIPGRSTAYKYLEALWDLGPSDRVGVLGKLNKGITRFVSDQPEYERDNASWAYGPTIFKELPRVARHLNNDPTSRRAVIVMPRDLRAHGTPPCLVSIQFFVRDNRLHCVAHMRSNDVWLGLPLDMFQFGLMQNVVARYIGIPVGSYIHVANSMHLYERDALKLTNFIKQIEGKNWIQDGEAPCRPFLLLDDPVEEIETCRLYSEIQNINDFNELGVRREKVPGPFGYYLEEITKACHA